MSRVPIAMAIAGDFPVYRSFADGVFVAWAFSGFFFVVLAFGERGGEKQREQKKKEERER